MKGWLLDPLLIPPPQGERGEQAGLLCVVLERRADGGEERGERVGAMINMGRQLGPGGNRPMLGVIGQAVYQHRGHAERVRGLEIVRQVVEHRSLARNSTPCGVDEAVDRPPASGFG